MTSSGKVHDRVLLDALEKLKPDLFSGVVWRTTWKGRDPLVGSLGGGRWDPPNIEVLYASTEQNGSLAEAYYHLSQAPVFTSGEVLNHQLTVKIDSMLSLNEYTLKCLGIDEPLSNHVDYSLTQAISSAARFLEFQGLLIPSARWPCNNLAIFLDQIDINETITVGDNYQVNWPAWKEEHKT